MWHRLSDTQVITKHITSDNTIVLRVYTKGVITLEKQFETEVQANTYIMLQQRLCEAQEEVSTTVNLGRQTLNQDKLTKDSMVEDEDKPHTKHPLKQKGLKLEKRKSKC